MLYYFTCQLYKENAGIYYVDFVLDGRSLMAAPYRPDYDGKSYLDCYYGLIQALRKPGGQTSVDVEYTTFAVRNTQQLSPYFVVQYRCIIFRINVLYMPLLLRATRKKNLKMELLGPNYGLVQRLTGLKLLLGLLLENFDNACTLIRIDKLR